MTRLLSVCTLLLCLPQFGGGCTTTSHRVPENDKQYLVIDLSEGSNATSYPVSYLSDVPEGGWTTEYKTNKLVLRRIEAGTFMMGSPVNELGRRSNEYLYQVTLTEPYYIGVFEVTQKQWALVMGSHPSHYKGDARPVERISYDMIRGSSKGALWPASVEVDHASFMGKLRAKTKQDFDLPTDAQWEYACRAGTTTALHSNKNLTDVVKCKEMDQVGRYRANWLDGKGNYASSHTTVGSYLPNNWGLYDMHGNLWEWCLDWYIPPIGDAPITDPVGATLGSDRLFRGGSWLNDAQYCRSADRQHGRPPSEKRINYGLRVAVRIGQ